MVGLDVVHHRDGGIEREEGLIVLIRLDHEEAVAGHPRVASPGTHPPAGDAGGIESCGGERLGGHHRGGRLAVGAGDGHGARALDQRGQRHLPRNHRHAGLARPGQLGMSRGHRGRHHQRAGAVHVRRIVPPQDRDAKRAEIGRAGGIGVAAAHPNPATGRDQRKRAHAGPTDPDKVDRAVIRRAEEVHGVELM
jgi:hypothetical protein